MANLFEKPIAANPMSTFSALPLEYLDKSLERRQQKYDYGKALLSQEEDEFLKLGYLPGDAERHMELRKTWESQMDELVDNVGGDYSRIMPQLDRFTRQLKREISYGELGAQNTAYQQAGEFKKKADQMLAEGKISQEGYNMAMHSVSSHKTVPTSQGNWQKFSGYNPSTDVNPVKTLQDGVDEIVSKYSADGMKYVDRDLIRQNVLTQLATNTSLKKALQEKVFGTYGIEANQGQFNDYVTSVIESVITDKRFQEVPALKDAQGNIVKSGMASTLFDVQQPQHMQDIQYQGASVPWMRNAFQALGFDAWGEFKKTTQTPEMQERIKYIEKRTGTKFPSSPYEQADWLKQNVDQTHVGEIQTRPATNAEMRFVDSQGFFTDPNVAVYDRKGRLLDKDEIRNIQGGSKSGSDTRSGVRTASITQAVTAGKGYPQGTLVLRGADGEQYFVENRNPENINSPEYNNSLIEMASGPTSGTAIVTLRAPVDQIPPGTYEVKHISGNNYNLYQNGVLKYRKFTANNGTVYGQPVSQDENNE